MSLFNDKIFREYDIRGVYETDYKDSFADLLGHAVAQYFIQNKKPLKKRDRFQMALGRDARPSGEILCHKFQNALIQEGFDVLDLGIVPTPVVYFSTFHFDVDGAVCITGSHNPSAYNGFKICCGTTTLYGSEIQELLKLCKKIEMSKASSTRPKPGSTTAVDSINPYLKDIQSRIHLERKLTVVLDAGNGTASIVAPKLISDLGAQVIPLYCELDGSFPNHHPDPTVMENLRDLQKAVIEHKADLGIAYDGDADRIGVVNEKGIPIFGDELMVLYSREILSRKPGAKIISEVKSSHKLYQDIAKHGGKPIMWKTGHSLIKAKMKEEKAEFAGEMSGHMFFADRYYGYDDAIYASTRLLELLSKQSKPLSALLADLPVTVSTPEIRVDCEDEIKFEVVKQVKEELSKKYKTIDIDGVRIETSSGWGLLRASNTQPVVVMRFEANSKDELSDIRKIIENAFKHSYSEIKARR